MEVSETNSPQNLWVIEQINEQWAELQSVYVTDAENEPLSISLPLQLLPFQCREGLIVEMSLSLNYAAGEKVKQQVQDTLSALTEEDDGEDFSL